MDDGLFGFPNNLLGYIRATALRILGKPGATAGASLAGGTTSGAPTSGTFEVGELVVTHDGHVLVCTTAGSPGSWTDAGTAGGLVSPLSARGDLWGYDSADGRVPIGSNGTVLTADSAQTLGLHWVTPTTGTVTSVQVAVPAPLSASGGPLTSSGTITLAWTTGQTANQVLASPDGTTGAVSLRALVATDIPSLNASKITAGQLALARGGTSLDASAVTDGQLLIGQSSDHTFGLATLTAGSGITVTNAGHGITISASGGGGSGTVTSVDVAVPTGLSSSGGPITSSGTITLAWSSQSANRVLASPDGASGTPTFRALASTDLPLAAPGSAGAIKPGRGLVTTSDGTTMPAGVSADQIASVDVGSVVGAPLAPAARLYLAGIAL